MAEITAAQHRRVAARVNRLFTEADRAEAAIVADLRSTLSDLQGQVRSVVAGLWGSPVTAVDSEVRVAVRGWTERATGRLQAGLTRARADGRALIDGVAEVLDVAVPLTENAEREALEDAQAAAVVNGAGQLVADGVTFELLRAQGSEDSDPLPTVLAGIGSAVAGSSVFGRPAERLEGQARSVLGAAAGAATLARATAADRAGLTTHKRWIVQHDGKNRQEHLDAEARYSPGSIPGPIPWSEDFRVGAWSTPVPRGPGLPAGQKAHCQCRAVPVAVATPAAAAV